MTIELDLEKLIAISHVKRAAEEGVTRAKLEEIRERIKQDIRKFRELVQTPAREHQPDYAPPQTRNPKGAALSRTA